MGKYLKPLAKKKEINISEVNENQPTLTGARRKKGNIPTSTNLQNLQKGEKIHWRDRDANYWNRVKHSVSLGATMICATLQPFAPLFAEANKGALPAGGVLVPIGGEWYDFRDIAGCLLAVEADWTRLSQICNRANRPLTPKEGAALNRAKEFLIWVDAAHSPDGWRDLESFVEGALN